MTDIRKFILKVTARMLVPEH